MARTHTPQGDTAALQEGPSPSAHVPAARLPRAARWRAAILGAALALAAGHLWQESRRQPIPPAAGAELAGEIDSARENPAADGRFRLASFNIHHGEGTDGVHDLDRIADALDGADLAVLQEVWTPFFGLRSDQPRVLGERLGMRWLYAPTERRWWHEPYGNALLAGLPIERWRRIPLPRGGGTHRNLLVVEFIAAGRRVTLLSTHLERANAADRRTQLDWVIGEFLACEPPAILAGDLNTDAGDPELAKLLARSDVGDPLAERGVTSPPGRIDWILTRGLETLDAGHRAGPASDHPCIWAELVPVR